MQDTTNQTPAVQSGKTPDFAPIPIITENTLSFFSHLTFRVLVAVRFIHSNKMIKWVTIKQLTEEFNRINTEVQLSERQVAAVMENIAELFCWDKIENEEVFKWRFQPKD